jgi:hypothetical protein
MRRALPFFIPAALLAVAGAVLIAMGRLERRVVDLRRSVLALQFETAVDAARQLDAPIGAWLPGFASRRATARDERTAAEYWGAREEAASSPEPTKSASAAADPRMLLVAANRAYRRIDFKHEPRRLMQELREVADAYGEVLKRSPWQFDAAYNYQFVARVRAMIARGAAGRPAPAPPAAPEPPARSIHGRSGAESPGLQIDEFKVIVPHQSDERREEQEAGKSVPRARKG